MLPELRDWVWPFFTDYQRQGTAFAVARRNAHLFWECGCLAGDTVIRSVQPGAFATPETMTLKALNTLWWDAVQHEGVRNAQVYLPACYMGPHHTRTICLNQIDGVFASGVKPVLRLTLETGETLRATADHVMICPQGERPLGDLRPGDPVLFVPHGQWSAVPRYVQRLEPAGETETFDIRMVADPHNFVANGFVVHNSGKTAAACAWAVAEPGPVVCFTIPGAREQWGDAVRQFTTVDPYVVLPEGLREPGAELLEEYLARKDSERDRPFVIIGWDTLMDDLFYLRLPKFKALRRPSIIADEIHEIKDFHRWKPVPPKKPGDPVTFIERRSVAARGAFYLRTGTRRLGLTATPVPNRIKDLWAILDAVEPGCMGRFMDFAKEYCGAVEGTYGWLLDGASNLGKLRKIVARRAHVVRPEQVYAQLPPFRRETTYLTPDILGRADAEATAEVRRAAKLVGGGSGLERKANASTLLEAQLRLNAAKKTPFVVKHVAELLASGQKVLVFTGRKKDAEKIAEGLKAEAAKRVKASFPVNPEPWTVWMAHGETPTTERREIQKAYLAAARSACIVGTGDAWGTGLDLQDTDRLIIVLLPWTWLQFRQWEGRVRRLGQRRACILEYLVCKGTIEEHIAATAIDKFEQIGGIFASDTLSEITDAVRGGTVDELMDSLLNMILSAPERAL